jgi:hypothetical protein
LPGLLNVLFLFIKHYAYRCPCTLKIKSLLERKALVRVAGGDTSTCSVHTPRRAIFRGTPAIAEKDDVPKEKRSLYDQLFPIIQSLIIQIGSK